MRVLVCGGREFQDYAMLRMVLDTQHDGEPITLLIHGDAVGADRLAGRWARTRGVVVKAFPANWDRDGKAAGPIRNSAMLAERPELVIAFPGGKGTADMIRKAMKAGVPVHAPVNAIQESLKTGITHAQAMEIGRRFHEGSDAAPTIAHAMGVDYETVCASLDGRLWPGVRRYWMDRVFP